MTSVLVAAKPGMFIQSSFPIPLTVVAIAVPIAPTLRRWPAATASSPATWSRIALTVLL